MWMRDKIHIKQMVDNKRISELISKELTFGLSREEDRELQSWINKSEHNLQLYIDIVDKKNLERYIQERENIDVSRNWSSFQKRVSAQNRVSGQKRVSVPRMASGESRRKYISLFSRYAAVLLFVVSIGVVFYQISKTKNFSSQMAKTSVIQKKSNKARLILDNGKQINLNSSIDTSLINNTGISINKDSSLIQYVGRDNKDQKPKINKIVVPRGGEYNLVLADGTKVYLNSDTEIEFPVDFIGERRSVKIKGEAFFHVAKDKTKPFVVETQLMNIVVTGTQFNVKAYDDDDKIQTTLVEGGVDVYYGNNKKCKKSIVPSQQAELIRGNDELFIRKVDTEIYTSWLNRYFIFKNERLEDIMKTLSRWYDVNVFFQNSEIKDIMFDGKLKRYDSISSILEIIETTNSIKTEINRETIIFRKK